jgi:hypothetical protein
MKNIQVIAIIKVDINHETETLQHLNILVDKTRKEKGCLQYNLVKDQQEDGTFVMVELWETSESLKLHSQSTHLADFGAYLHKIGGKLTIHMGEIIL